MMRSVDNEQILKLCRTLRVGHPLQKQLESVLANPQAEIDDLEPMMSALTRRSLFHDPERTIAVRVAMHANWSEAQRCNITRALSACVQKETRARKPGNLVARWFCRGMVLSMLLWAGCDALIRHDLPDPGFWNLLFDALTVSTVFTVLASFVTAPISVWYDNCYSLRYVNAIEVLGLLGQNSAILPVATALMSPPLRAVAAQELPRIVDRLTSEDYGSLPAEAVPELCRALATVSPATALVILSALTVIGDGRALYAVEFAAHNHADKEVREAAMSLIPVLNMRAQESRTSAMLLRPSSAAPTGDQTLLRATREPADAHEDQLLRVNGE